MRYAVKKSILLPVLIFALIGGAYGVGIHFNAKGNSGVDTPLSTPQNSMVSEPIMPVPTPEPTPSPYLAKLPLVNVWHPIADDYSVELVKGPNQHLVSTECYDDLTQMFEDCRNAGLNPMVCSGYRTQEFQENLFENKVRRVMNEGYGRAEAEEIAAMSVARPGTSEHQTGLAVDIIDADFKVLTEEQEQRPTQKWLLENSWKYGFVLRYPSGKSELTGVIYEPWHYRYVGKEVAKELHERGQCLEEYLGGY